MTLENTALNGDPSVHCEMTPKVYYEHYVRAMPNFDLYPSLCRRMGNGYQPRREHTVWKSRQVDFAMMNTRDTASPTVINHQPTTVADTAPTWDLYPLVFRNVENFGTDQMRQRLRQSMATV